MRIVGGTARGRRLRTPDGRATRPTSDRVREALFSIVTARLALRGARVLDLFAGSGALGLEALSRGAAATVFVEHNRSCCNVIAHNAKSLGFANQCDIVCTSIAAALPALAKRGLSFELVLMDPPYAIEPWQTLEAIAQHELLANDALVVLEHATKLSPRTACGPLTAQLTRRYGDTSLTLYRVGPTPE